MDTLLTGQDPFDRRYAVGYGQPPGAITPADHAMETAARRYARQRLLMGLAGGLAAGVQPEGFFGNFARAFSGAAGTGYQVGQQQHEQEQEAVKMEAAKQKAQRDYQHQTEQDAAAFDAILRQRTRDAEIARHNRALEAKQGTPARQYGQLPWWLNPDVPAADRAVGKRNFLTGKVKPAKEPKVAPPPKIQRRIPNGLTEQGIIDSINQETDPNHLSTYVTGKGGADSADIRRAAQLRANYIKSQSH